VAERLAQRLAKVVVGDLSVEGVKIGALASRLKQAGVAERVALLSRRNETVFGDSGTFKPAGDGVANGAFFSPTLLVARKAGLDSAAHDVEAFGPVSTLMPYRDQGSCLLGTMLCSPQ
jgi:oxepin-CoA hydrolase/3-oxo-5,6-dehydrosuberyl-CoA semialdehyde dehydrogenase